MTAAAAPADRELAARIFLDGAGRPRTGWRLLAFILLFLAIGVLLAGLGDWLVSIPSTAPPEAAPETHLWWGLAVGLSSALGATWLVAGRLEGLPLAAVGLPVDGATLRDIGGGLALGAGAIGLVVLALAAAGWVSWELAGVAADGAGSPGGEGAASPGSAWWAAGRVTLLLAGAAWMEELLFRGYPFQLLFEGLGGAAALAISSVAFGLLHAGNPFAAPLPLLNITLAGVLLGVAYRKTWSLWFATGVHLGWNWAMAVGAGLPVSGLALQASPLRATVRGPELWTGGAFGPEGGLVTTLVTAGAILWLWRTPRLGARRRVLALHPPATRRRRAA